MTWNPLKLRRMVEEAATDLFYAARGEQRWRESCIEACQERDDLATQRDALLAEIARLKSPPRGDRGPRVGREK